MKKLLLAIPCILLGMAIGYFLPHKVTYVIPRSDTIWYKIDSIQTVIDTLEITKTQIIHEYETKESIISNNSCVEDYEFFSNFLRTRFASSNN